MEITNSNPEKIKDPMRVEAGKRLAAISKAAKERKRDLQASQDLKESTDWSLDFGYVIGVVGAIIGIGALYFSYKQDNKQEVQQQQQQNTQAEVKRDTIESFD